MPALRARICERNSDAVENPNLHGVLEGAEVTDLCTEHQVSELRISQENDEEHDSKTTNVFCALE